MTTRDERRLYEWLDQQIGREEDKDFPSNLAFAQAAGISEGTVRNLRNRTKWRKGYRPSIETLQTIAENIPTASIEELQRMAGFSAVPVDAERGPIERQILNINAKLSKKGSDRLLRFARLLFEEEREERRENTPG